MQNEILFRLITLFVLVATASIGSYFRWRAEREAGKLCTGEGQKLLIPLRLLGLFLLLPLLGYLFNPTWVAWARFDLPTWLRWLAAAVAIGLIPMFYWLFVSIGNNISPTQSTRHNHQLITYGPYRWIRHPLYSFGTLLIVALTLLSGLWWLTVAMLPPLAILIWRTSREEANLIATFGDEYRAYMQRTGRFWPKFYKIFKQAY